MSDTRLPDMRSKTLERHGPPEFLGDHVGARLDELEYTSAPWMVSRSISAPQLTHQLLLREPGFHILDPQSLTDAANTLTFLHAHSQQWRLHWAESHAGPSKFSDQRRVLVGVTEEQAQELGRTVGVKGSVKAGKAWAVAAEASARWSRLTRSTVSITLQSESVRALEFTVPAGGMDIALWQLESHLTRKLILRPSASLPPDPQPDWVDLAIAAPVQAATIPCNIIRTMTRSNNVST